MGTKKAKKFVSVKIDLETYTKLKKMALRRGESLSQLVTLLLNK